MSSIITNTIIFVGLAALVSLGYFLYLQNQDPVDAISIESAAASQQFVQQIKVLQSIDIDTSLFDQPGFRDLTSYSQPITPVAVGNTNPF